MNPDLRQVLERIWRECDAALAETDKPQPRAWRLWDMVLNTNNGRYFIRLPKFTTDKWYPLDNTGDDLTDVKVADFMPLPNLADLLAQGDLLIPMTQEEADNLRLGRIVQTVPNKCNVALAARKEDK